MNRRRTPALARSPSARPDGDGAAEPQPGQPGLCRQWALNRPEFQAEAWQAAGAGNGNSMHGFGSALAGDCAVLILARYQAQHTGGPTS